MRLQSVTGLQGVKVLEMTEAFRRLDGQLQARTPGTAYAVVAWVYRCAQLRANAVAHMPFTVTRRGTSQLTAVRGRTRRTGGEEVPASEVPWLTGFRPLLWRTEAALCLHGRGYWFLERNRVRTLGLRWIAPETIVELWDEASGLRGFERYLGRVGREGWDSTRYLTPEADPFSGSPGGGGVVTWAPEDLIHFWLPDPDVEVGPGRAPAQVALEAAGLVRNANLFAAGFFERGAVPAVLMSVDGNPPDPELRRLEAWWKRLARGVQNAWQTVAVRASLKVHVLGQPVKDLDMPGLKSAARREICTAFGVPQTLVEDAASFATAREHRKSFYLETVIPQCDLIAAQLNAQLFEPMGMEFAFLQEQHEVMQDEEVERAGALVALRNAGVPLLPAMQILGYDLSAETRRDLEGFVAEREIEYRSARRERDAEAAEQPLNLLRHVVPPVHQDLGANGLGRNYEA